MTVRELAAALHLEVLAMPDPDATVHGAYTGDLLSWVMGRAEAGCVWVTIMTNLNVIAVASLVGTAATVIAEGCELPPEMIEVAAAKGVNLLRTSLPAYEFCLLLGGALSDTP